MQLHSHGHLVLLQRQHRITGSLQAGEQHKRRRLHSKKASQAVGERQASRHCCHQGQTVASTPPWETCNTAGSLWPAAPQYCAMLYSAVLQWRPLPAWALEIWHPGILPNFVHCKMQAHKLYQGSCAAPSPSDGAHHKSLETRTPQCTTHTQVRLRTRWGAGRTHGVLCLWHIVVGDIGDEAQGALRAHHQVLDDADGV